MRFIILYFLLAVSPGAFATDVSFVVYYSNGTPMKSGTKKPLKKGDQLFLKDVITIAAPGKLVLLCSNYKAIQLNKPGTYSVKNLLGSCGKSTESYSNAYLKYVWEQFTSPEGSPEKDPSAYMKNVGAVSRGCMEVSTSVKSDTLRFYAGTFAISWSASYQTSQAAVYDQPYDGTALKTLSLQEDKPFEMKDMLRGLPAGNYYWQIQGPNGTNCERKYVQVWNKKTYSQQLSSIRKAIIPSSPAEEAFATGFALQENFFMAEALSWYEKAAKLEPNNPIYKKATETFYDKNF